MKEYNPYHPPETNSLQLAVSDEKESIAGLKGWLIFVGMMVCIKPIFILVAIVQSIRIILSNAWVHLTDPLFSTYMAGFKLFFISEVCANIALLLFLSWLIALFFRKKYQFKRYFIVGLVIMPVLLVLDTWSAYLMFPTKYVVDFNTYREMGCSLLAIAIWVPYMRRSKRVKNTFVN